MKINYSKNTIEIAGQEIDVFRIENDQNGNPRYVIHYLDLLTEDEVKQITEETNELLKAFPFEYFSAPYRMFKAALNKARKMGGKKYRGKWFGGGIVFQSYNLRDSLKTLFS